MFCLKGKIYIYVKIARWTFEVKHRSSDNFTNILEHLFCPQIPKVKKRLTT